jgi:hypothetical protein
MFVIQSLIGWARVIESNYVSLKESWTFVKHIAYRNPLASTVDRKKTPANEDEEWLDSFFNISI